MFKRNRFNDLIHNSWFPCAPFCEFSFCARKEKRHNKMSKVAVIREQLAGADSDVLTSAAPFSGGETSKMLSHCCVVGAASGAAGSSTDGSSTVAAVDKAIDSYKENGNGFVQGKQFDLALEEYGKALKLLQRSETDRCNQQRLHDTKEQRRDGASSSSWGAKEAADLAHPMASQQRRKTTIALLSNSIHCLLQLAELEAASSESMVKPSDPRLKRAVRLADRATARAAISAEGDSEVAARQVLTLHAKVHYRKALALRHQQEFEGALQSFAASGKLNDPGNQAVAEDLERQIAFTKEAHSRMLGTERGVYAKMFA